MLIALSRLWRAPLALTLTLSIFAPMLHAQTDAAGLFGVVKDSTGGVIANCRIRVQNRATGVAREQATDGNGLYHFEVLPPGEYELTAEAPGFKQFRDSQVRIQVAQLSRLSLQLEVGGASEFVEVQGTTSPPPQRDSCTGHCD